MFRGDGQHRVRRRQCVAPEPGFGGVIEIPDGGAEARVSFIHAGAKAIEHGCGARQRGAELVECFERSEELAAIGQLGGQGPLLGGGFEADQVGMAHAAIAELAHGRDHFQGMPGFESARAWTNPSRESVWRNSTSPFSPVLSASAARRSRQAPSV